MKQLAKWLNKYQNAKILDVGSGNGAFISMIGSLYDGYESMLGIDVLEVSVNTSNKNFKEHERISFEQMNVLDMDIDDNTFDIVTLSNTLHHLEELKDTLHEMERVCKKDGIIIINEMIRNPLNERQISHRMLHHFAAKVDHLRGDYHAYTFTANEILKLLENHSSFKIKDAWDLKTPQTPENTEEEIEWLTTTLDRIVEKIKDHEKYHELKEEATTIKEYIRAHGFEAATSLLVVLHA